MVSYGVAKARAMASKRNWNEEEYTSKATITWADCIQFQANACYREKDIEKVKKAFEMP